MTVIPRTYGRMGNFLFQAAAAMGYAWRHGLDYTLPSTTKDAKNNPIYLQHLARPFDSAARQVVIKEIDHGYQELPFDPSWKRDDVNIVLDGYWQTEKYFKEFSERIRTEFAYPWICRWKFVSVHVRRGDYLQLTRKHPPVPKQWIENAMREFPGFCFQFFSDDIPWCRENFGERGDCFFAQGNEVDDLVGMSQCEHHICSASTFSWWGAWLNRNPNKVVVMPKNWFQPGYRNLNTSDIVPKEWRRV